MFSSNGKNFTIVLFMIYVFCLLAPIKHFLTQDEIIFVINDTAYYAIMFSILLVQIIIVVIRLLSED